MFDQFSLGFNIEYLEKLVMKETLEVEEIDEGEHVRVFICWDCETPQNFQSNSDFQRHLLSHTIIKSENNDQHSETILSDSTGNKSTSDTENYKSYKTQKLLEGCEKI